MGGRKEGRKGSIVVYEKTILFQANCGLFLTIACSGAHWSYPQSLSRLFSLTHISLPIFIIYKAEEMPVS